MARPVFFLVWVLALLAASLTSADIVEHSFKVKDMTLQRLCRNQVITTVNEGLPAQQYWLMRETPLLFMSLTNHLTTLLFIGMEFFKY
ncbi:hypothetical protein CsSME_00017383 [Camellia sinensis var. sinensis]